MVTFRRLSVLSVSRLAVGTSTCLIKVLLAHGTYLPDHTRISQPASLTPHIIPAASVSQTRDLSLQPLRLKALQAYRMDG